jgi:hypothetical protein
VHAGLEFGRRDIVTPDSVSLRGRSYLLPVPAKRMASYVELHRRTLCLITREPPQNVNRVPTVSELPLT